MKLSKEDWRQLDTLLGKVGFGGYYDLVECLRTAIINIVGYNPDFTETVQKETDIQVLVTLLIKVSKRN